MSEKEIKSMIVKLQEMQPHVSALQSAMTEKLEAIPAKEKSKQRYWDVRLRSCAADDAFESLVGAICSLTQVLKYYNI